MEPPAKRPKLGGGTRGDTTQSSEALQNYHNSSRPSNRFEGYGVQNTGNFTISGDLTMHINEQPNTSTGVNKHQKLLDSLHFEQIDARQLTIKKAYAHTCAWFLESPPYRDWAKNKSTMCNDHNFLWIKGKPGAGKSTLMKFLLGKLRNQIRQAGNQEILISFFFNARGDDLEKTTTGMYRSLLFQLLEMRPDLRYVLDSIRIGHTWNIGSLKSLFEEVLQGLGDTSLLCLIDALDECEEAQIRDMVSFLSDPGVISNRFRICFASRHYPHITIKTGRSLVLETQIGHSQDIESYLHSALVIEDSILAEQIRCDLQNKASGVFMWVVLVVDILNKEYDAGCEHNLRARIQQLPGDLHDLFLDILTRDDNNLNGLLLCIQWVLFARRPLTPKQLYFAILCKLEPHQFSPLHPYDLPADLIKRYILNISKGLVEYTRSKSSTIQFIHESVRDFLLKENGLNKVWPDISANAVGLSHDILKNCCQKYMSIKEIRDHGTSPREIMIRKFPFLDYAYQEILFHSDQAQRYNICQQNFLVTFPRRQWVKYQNVFEEARIRRYTPKVSLLYILAENGMTALIRAQPNRQSCFEVEDERYGLPVLAANATKSREAIQAMLELETKRWSETSLAKLYSMMPPSLDISCASGRNFKFSRKRELFHQLVEYGNEKTALFFLAGVGCDIYKTNPGGDLILVSAVGKNFQVLVETLLRCDADILTSGRGRLTALCIASMRGRTEISKLLIESGADIQTTTEERDSPLHYAVEGGHIEIAKLLIDRGANVSATGKFGRSLLQMAIFSGHIETAKLLIESGANLSAVDDYGDTALTLALKLAPRTLQGLTEVVKILLKHGAKG
ncbi:hypothetical protein FHL15_003276 [Xylaria flabelliformis]|uniref:NACHT domain-containing protein n=1 Tax=Xylaria flabelliformis TaxID=2512241 RepID=A0A553I6A3_9PEZI|nr:hypothetical protein FHL15_003276 [Xylaria flabelliformis]